MKTKLSLIFLLVMVAACTPKPDPQSCTDGNAKACARLGILHLDSDAGYQDSVALLNKAQVINRADAISELKAACDKQNLTGCRALGKLLWEANRLNDAEEIFRKACTGGHVKSCLELGAILRAQNKTQEANDIFTKICSGGEPQSCSLLGIMADDAGEHEKAEHFYELSCKQGIACRNLALSAERKKDFKRAKELYSTDCENGDWGSCNNLGSIFLKIDHDLDNAAKYYQKACDSGMPLNCFGVAQVKYCAGKNPEGEKKVQEALNMARKMCTERGMVSCEFETKIQVEFDKIELLISKNKGRLPREYCQTFQQ